MACVAIRQPRAAKGSILRASVEASWKGMPALSSSANPRHIAQVRGTSQPSA